MYTKDFVEKKHY